ncbi:unnamed protein product [Rhizoctonia solani]|uniref:Glycoside hydrolase family 5 domain-containing protein n=1 Tax=Rhizoctonia solani TaxID=456999 RepID=A0A8H3GL83_9AGAM|nr:unnamed protein product [Rhizoctonia solani]
MRSLLTSLVALASGHAALAAFTSLTAKETFARMTPGWNLGNTLDALPTEGSWMAPVQNVTFSQVYADGFRSVRIPITFNDHFISDAPNYTVDPAWLSRINYVVDAALSTGLFVVVNVDADKALVESEIKPVRGNFSVPILMGEYSTSAPGIAIEKASAWAWFDTVTRTALKYEIVPQWWDNGGEYFDRVTGKWRDITTRNIVMAIAAGKINSYPYSGNGTVWLKSGVSTIQPIYMQYNGNQLKGIYTPSGTQLSSGKDYTVVNSPLPGFVLTPSYINSLGATSKLGELGRVIVKLSAGADLEIDIRRYTRPTVPSGTINVSGTSGDYLFNHTPNGAKLATVKALGPNGEYLKDDWTQWLGPLQAGRINWNGDYSLSDDQTQLIIRASLLSAIKSFGKPVTLTWEFWPRTDASNTATTVVTVT